MENIVVVGTGDYFWGLLRPTLKFMQNFGLVKVLKTVDICEREEDKNALPRNLEHIIRVFPNQSLNELLRDLRDYNPTVILCHFNEFHTPDTANLASCDFKVMVEKPYAIDAEQFASLDATTKKHSGSVSLLQYYLMMKSIPLLVLGGKVREESFYFNENGVLKADGILRDPRDLSGRFNDVIGKPKSILVEILEGEGNYGRLEHRGQHLVDTSLGGGMIQDLGLHAVAPLFALQEYIGRIDRSFFVGSVSTAKCEEYADMASKKYKLTDQQIGETYADIGFETTSHVPVILRVGKYVLNQENRRRIVIVGSYGTIDYDLTNNKISLPYKNGDLILECPKTCEKYYPVIRAGLEQLKGNNLFYFDPIAVSLAAQEFILNVLRKSRLSESRIYSTGVNPETIFT